MGHDERAHARFNFSGAHRWLNCEGCIPLCETLPAQESTPYAKKGTLQHEANEKLLTMFLDYKKTGVGTEFQHDEFTGTVEDDADCEFVAVDALQTSKLYTKLIWERVLESALTGKAYAIEDKVILNAELDLWGSADFWAVHIDDKARRTGVFVEYKNGHYVVELKKNPQLMLYALALRAEMRRRGKDLDVVRTAIIQPNANCEPYRECSYTSKQLDTFEKQVYKKVNAILTTKKPKFKVGKWCTFCPAMAVCEAHKKDLESKELLPKLRDEPLPEVTKLSDATLASIALHGDGLEEFLKAVRLHIIARHLQGKPVAGCKVVEKSGKRGWIKNEDLIANQLRAKGLEPYRPKLITISEAKKKLTDEELKELTEVGKTTHTIVSLDDVRPDAKSATDIL